MNTGKSKFIEVLGKLEVALRSFALRKVLENPLVSLLCHKSRTPELRGRQSNDGRLPEAGCIQSPATALWTRTGRDENAIPSTYLSVQTLFFSAYMLKLGMNKWAAP